MPQKTLIVWTEDNEKLLADLWVNRLDLSAAKIAERMGMEEGGRNAIIGKARRMKLPLRGEATGPQRHSRHKPRPRPRPAKIPMLPKPPSMPKPPSIPAESEPLAGSQLIPLEELNYDSCRWPFGNGPFLFCGRQVAPNKGTKNGPKRHCSYCPEHEAISYPGRGGWV